jgi:hypothetical protein
MFKWMQWYTLLDVVMNLKEIPVRGNSPFIYPLRVWSAEKCKKVHGSCGVITGTVAGSEVPKDVCGFPVYHNEVD